MNKFEEYLRNHRDQLDLPDVHPRVWEQVQQRTQPQRARVYYLYRVAAAAAAILLLLGVFQWGRHSAQPLVIPTAMAQQYDLPNTGIETLITEQINNIQAASVPVSYRDDLQLLLQQVHYLDQQYATQRTSLQTGQYTDDLLHDVLRYYRAKVDLLTRVLSEIEKINHYEKDNHTE
ncbi:MAG: hypothetical protein AAGJ82_12815, partial [Bacteroidota bacterium]